MSILLVNPPLFWGHGRNAISYFDVTRKQIGSAEDLAEHPAEHLGLGSMQAYCALQGIDVDLVNGMTAQHRTVDETFAEIEEVVRNKGAPVLIGFSGTNLVFGGTRTLAERCHARWPEVRVILGYDFATLNFKRLLSDYPAIDFVCRGDGETVFAALARRLLDGRSYEDIAGLAFRKSDGTIADSAPEALDLDTLPRPTRGDLARVLKMGYCAALYASRGCPYRCSYCTMGETSALFGKQAYRLRSIDLIVDEMEYLSRDHGVTFVTIADDLFLTRAPSSIERAERFANEILRRGLKMRWMVDCRVDSIEPTLFKLLHQAGMSKIFVGVETASEEQLALYNKRYLLRQETPAHRLRRVVDLGIKVVPGILTFHPQVTPRELRATLGMIDEIGWKGHYQLLNRVRAYPGTPLYSQYEEKGWLTGGEWPVKTWDFVDPRARQMHFQASIASMRPGSTFEDVRDVFHQHLDAWERNEAVSASAPVDPAVRAAVDAAAENEGSV